MRRTWFLPAGLIVGIAYLSAPSLVRADFEVRVEEGTVTTTAGTVWQFDYGSNNFNGTTPADGSLKVSTTGTNNLATTTIYSTLNGNGSLSNPITSSSLTTGQTYYILTSGTTSSPKYVSFTFIIDANSNGDNQISIGGANDKGQFGDFSLTGTVSETNNTPTADNQSVADLNISNLAVVNKDKNNTHTLTVFASETGYTFPSPPLQTLAATLDSFSTVSGTVSGNVLGVADNNNGQFSTSGTLSKSEATAGDTALSTPGTLDLNGYSLNNDFSLTLSKGGSVGLSGSDVQVIPSPEPKSWVLSCAGFGFLGAGCWFLRSRRTLKMS